MAVKNGVFTDVLSKEVTTYEIDSGQGNEWLSIQRGQASQKIRAVLDKSSDSNRL